MRILNILLSVFIVVLALIHNARSGGCIERYGKCSPTNSNCCEPSQCYFSFNKCF
ncbi:hypothetical protein O3M35_009934 [Rhynocoris fuscipes]|uniref:Uncharacterized protein n=1 Tax=Rhynocoris fuscipes TaxID=488301 RepID=A0AAW1D742_9HEMI